MKNLPNAFVGAPPPPELTTMPPFPPELQDIPPMPDSIKTPEEADAWVAMEQRRLGDKRRIWQNAKREELDAARQKWLKEQDLESKKFEDMLAGFVNAVAETDFGCVFLQMLAGHCRHGENGVKTNNGTLEQNALENVIVRAAVAGVYTDVVESRLTTENKVRVLTFKPKT